MHRLVVFVILLAAPAVRADPPSAPFVSAGLVLSAGSRGFAIGVEVSAGSYSNQTGAHLGVAGGFDFAPASGDLPAHRAYIEAEGGWIGFGVGVGPAFFFDGGRPVGLQITPYGAASLGLITCKRHEPFELVGLFYRFTRRPEERGQHEVGFFGKALWFVNGVDDNGVCIH